MHFGKNSRKTIAGDENHHIFASETTKTGQPVGVKTTKQQEIKNTMKSVKKGLANMVKFLMFISPVYPQCTQGM